jgi:hypothetical protein
MYGHLHRHTRAGHGGHGLLRVQESGDRAHQPGQPVAVHPIRPPEVVDHLRDRVPADRVSLVVRQLQIRHHRAVPVGPPRLPQEHAYNSTTSEQLTPGDTPISRVPTRFRGFGSLARPRPATTLSIKPESAYELRKSGQ